jgi:hypothetical protein
MTEERQREIENIEWQIRKLERGIKVCHISRQNIHGTNVNYDSMIKTYVKDIKELRDRLEKLTVKKYFSSGRWKILTKGRRSPTIPKWPV